MVSVTVLYEPPRPTSKVAPVALTIVLSKVNVYLPLFTPAGRRKLAVTLIVPLVPTPPLLVRMPALVLDVVASATNWTLPPLCVALKSPPDSR